MSNPRDNPNLIDYFRRNAIERYLELGLSANQIQEAFKGTELARRRTDLLATIRTIRATMAAATNVVATAGGNLLDLSAFAPTDQRIPTRYYVDANVTILAGESGELVDIKRRVWFNENMSRDDLDALIQESSGEAYGNLVVDIEITAAAARQ